MKALLLTALAATCLSFAAENRPADEKAVRAALDKFNAAAKAGDTATLDKLLSPDLIYVHSNALLEDKAACIAALAKGKPNFVLDPGSTVQVYNAGKTAIVHGRLTANGNLNGKATSTYLDFIQVWIKDGNDWKMTTRHTVKPAPPQK